jgi:nucleotide-binding universal stress UspA family protein
MFKKILIAYDGSIHSQRSLRCAQDLAQKYGAELVLVHAYHPVSRALGLSLFHQVEGEMIAVGQKVMQAAQSELVSSGLQITNELLEGPPAEAILRVAETRQCDLIVMGSRGLGELQSALLGSVSHKVLHLSTVPVMIVR